jgi:hypothetical protein
MNVELADDIAEGADVDLLDLKNLFDHVADKHHFVHEPMLVLGGQLENLSDLISARNQDEPGKSLVVHEQQST